MSSDERLWDEYLGELFERYRRAVISGASADARDAILETFSIALTSFEENPTRDLSLTIAAGECEENAAWDAAESTYFEILSLPDIEPSTEYMARGKLACLYRLLHRDSDALDQTRLATAAARRADIPIVLSMALRGEARCLIRCGQIDDARQALAEALSLFDNGKMCFDDMHGQSRAAILTLRAECALHDGAIRDAEGDLEQAFDLLRPLAGIEIAAGVHSDLANWWSITAKLRSASDHGDGAIAAWREALRISKHVASLPQVETPYTKMLIADALDGLADALLACDRSDDAAAAIDERMDILRCIGLPENTA